MWLVAQHCVSQTNAPKNKVRLTTKFLATFTRIGFSYLCVIAGNSLLAAPADQAFAEIEATLPWSEAESQFDQNLVQLNEIYLSAKGSKGSRFATYTIRDSDQSQFELYDRDGIYITPQHRVDYSHELELRLKPSASIDFEALPASKRIDVVIDAIAKSEPELRRLIPAADIEDALLARQLLQTPSSLLISLSVVDVNERPTVAPGFLPTVNHGRGFILRLKDTERIRRISGETLFRDPEGQPLFYKPNSEDIEIREYRGYSPNFGNNPIVFGDTDVDDNFLIGNDPASAGNTITARINGSTLEISPVKGSVDGIRKAEVWVRGWDQRGPTTVGTEFDPATAKNLAKITVFVQTGNNRLPHWPGGSTGFRVSVEENYVGVIAPQSGNWQATDPDGDTITYSLRGPSDASTCVPSVGVVGFTFAGACVWLDGETSPLVHVGEHLDFEAVRDDPNGHFLLLATDSKGAVAEAEIIITVKNIEEPISGGFRTRFLSIHLPTSSSMRINLNSLFRDPEGQEAITFIAQSDASTIVSVNAAPAPWLEITAHQIGRARIHATATSKTSAHTSSVTVIVRDTNAAPRFAADSQDIYLTVLENIKIGDRVPTPIVATDPDVGDVLEFQVKDNTNFGLTGQDLPVNEVQLVTKSLLDFETQSIHYLTLTVSDGVETDEVSVQIHVLDLDEAVQPTSAVIEPISLRVNEAYMLHAIPHFVDDEGRTPTFKVSGHNPDIADIFVRLPDEIHVFGRAVGSTRATLSAVDSSGGIAAKSFLINVGAPAPVEDDSDLPDQTMLTGLLELSFSAILNDPSRSLKITDTSSSNEDVLWALQPDDDTDTLVLYAWDLGTAEVTVIAEDEFSNSFSFSFAVSVVETIDAPNPEDDAPGGFVAHIANQVLQVDEREGFLNLIDIFTTDEQVTPVSFEISTSKAGVVFAALANTDVVAWWHALSCAEKVSVVGDPNPPVSTHPFCQDFALLSPANRTIVRDASASYLLLYGMARGETEVTITATYASISAISATFTATINTTTATTAASVPQHTAYVNETTQISLPELMAENVDLAHVVVRDKAIASATVNQASGRPVLSIEGLALGYTDVALVVLHSAQVVKTTQFSLRVANRAPRSKSSRIALTLEIGEATHIHDLGEVISDAQALTYVLFNVAPNEIVEASIEANQLRVSALQKGGAEVTVRAIDTFGESTDVLFAITVSDAKLNQIAESAFDDHGRAILNSLSSVIGTRLNQSFEDLDRVADRSLAWHDQQPRYGVAYEPDLRLDIVDVASNQTNSVLSPPMYAVASLTTAFPHINHQFKSTDATKSFTLWTDADTQLVTRNGPKDSGFPSNHSTRLNSFYVGAEVLVGNRWQLGFAGSQAVSDSSYAYGTAQRHNESQQRFMTPYARVRLNNDDSLWVLASAGKGFLANNPDTNEDLYPSDTLRTSVFMFGGTKTVTAKDEFVFAWRADAASLRMAVSSVDETLISTRLQRVRSGLHASKDLSFSEQHSIEPFMSINLRVDSNKDKKVEGGIEWIGGAHFAFKSLEVTAKARVFASQDDRSYGEKGFSIATTYNHTAAPGGFSLSLTPSWGNVLGSFDPFDLRNSQTNTARSFFDKELQESEFNLEGQIGYGLLVQRDRFLVTPYMRTEMRHVHDVTVGTRLHGLTPATKSLEFDVAMRRTELAFNEVDTGVGITATLRL